jgi:RNA-dependent RNA polymerase
VFFGFTENNLKAGHLLFFREGHDFTVETLKKEFGDLKAIYEESGYGKYAARLGLSFSSTIPAAEVCFLSLFSSGIYLVIYFRSIQRI